jgi:hypothetical protein
MRYLHNRREIAATHGHPSGGKRQFIAARSLINRLKKGNAYVVNHELELSAVGATRNQYPSARP